MSTPAPETAPRPRPSSAFAWAIASIAAFDVVLGLTLGVVLDPDTGQIVALVIGLVSLLVTLALARLDRIRLRTDGYESPHPAWTLLLSSVVYLALRTAKLRRAGVGSAGPLVLASISVAINVGLLLAVLVLYALTPVSAP